jgi:hypothetical protein
MSCPHPFAKGGRKDEAAGHASRPTVIAGLLSEILPAKLQLEDELHQIAGGRR